MLDAQGYVGLNLGSGSTGREDWINVDSAIFLVINHSRILRVILRPVLKILDSLYPVKVSDRKPPPNFIRVKLERGKLPFLDGSFNYVYTSHFLEHLERWEAIDLLKEIRRVLSKEGIVRIVVPDLKIVTETYLSEISKCVGQSSAGTDQNDTPAEKLNSYFGNGGGFPPKHLDRLPRFVRNYWSYQRRKWGHKYMYDYERLRTTLNRCGFREVRKYSYRSGQVPNIDFLDLEVYKEFSLYVEAS